MSLELHVWGPALGLPSIDPECLAAIGYFRHIVPRWDWTLIASNDIAVSPHRVLPALHHNGTWISGYTDIVAYLSAHCALSTDNDLTPQQRADSLACTSYLTTRGSALLALLLYVSPTAWVEVTRPAYSGLLTFPLTWTVAPAIRAAAVSKVERLGLGHLATAVEEMDASAQGGASTTSTGFLRMPERLSPSSTMQPEQTAAIRLQAMSDEFFTVLREMRGGKEFFLRDQRPSSVDFLAHAYLRLMLTPTPQPFLRKAMEHQSHARLLEYSTSDDVTLFGQEPKPQPQELPWKAPISRGVAGVLAKFADGALGHVPGVLGESWTRWRVGGVRSMKDDSVRDPAHDPSTALTFATTVTGLAAICAGLYFRSMPNMGAPVHRFEMPLEAMGGLKRFGEAGALLDALPWQQ